MAHGRVGELGGMPAPFELRRAVVDGQVVVCWGPKVVFQFDVSDIGMRNLAMVALSDGGVSVIEVAALFGVSPEHLSRIRGRVAAGGSGAVAPSMGRRPKLSDGQVRRAYLLADEGMTGSDIARRLRVSQPTISRLLSRRPPPVPETLALGDDVDGPGVEPGKEKEDEGNDSEGMGASGVSSRLAPIGLGDVASRYAGAMVRHEREEGWM